MSANRLEQMGAATRDRSAGRWLLPWQIAVYELILTFAVVGSYGLDVWIRGQVLASESRAIAALQVLGDVGNSKWGLVTGGCVVFGALVLRAASIRPAHRALYGWIAAAAGYVVASIAISGILTNVFKIIYGRARPRYLAEGETADWSLFAFDWSHQSFPSGHTTTLFAFAVAMCFLLPRFRVWLIAFAVVGGLARIAVNAHFLSDVIAGAAMGGFIAWWLRGFLARRNWVFQVRSDGTIKRLPIGRWWLARPVRRAAAAHRRRLPPQPLSPLLPGTGLPAGTAGAVHAAGPDRRRHVPPSGQRVLADRLHRRRRVSRHSASHLLLAAGRHRAGPDRKRVPEALAAKGHGAAAVLCSGRLWYRRWSGD